MVQEAKLTTEERNELPDKVFGLPDERKYPLNDKEHVLHAIKFFNYCPDEKQTELGGNINKALKKFNMKVNVGAGNKFSEHINPKFLDSKITESTMGEDIPDEYSDVIRNSLVSQLYIINTDTDNKISHKSLYSLLTKVDIPENIQETIKKVNDNNIDVVRLKINPLTTHELDDIDILKLTHELNTDLYYKQRARWDGENDYIWFGVCKGKLVYFLKTSIDENKYIGVAVTDELLDYIISKRTAPVTDVFIFDIIIEGDKPTVDVTEAVSINANGDVKLTIGKNKSYMDEYMEAHRILVENDKNGNVEAMKRNLAFMFSLISIIERDPKYIKRDPEVVKARAFATNDFKTYLKHVQKADPKFDFVKYYNESEYDKTIINIPRNTIIGIKKLVKTILS